MRWAGREPIEPNAHEGCECLSCCPPCQAEGCWDFDVTAYQVPVRGGTARVLLCHKHRIGVPWAAPSQPTLFDPIQQIDEPRTHARSTDPSTSHAAARALKIPAQALAVLRSYEPGVPLTDHDAYAMTGIGAEHHARQRCFDLRRAGLIEPDGSTATTPSGRPARRCRITDAGRKYLAAHPEDRR